MEVPWSQTQIEQSFLQINLLARPLHLLKKTLSGESVTRFHVIVPNNVQIIQKMNNALQTALTQKYSRPAVQ